MVSLLYNKVAVRDEHTQVTVHMKKVGASLCLEGYAADTQHRSGSMSLMQDDQKRYKL